MTTPDATSLAARFEAAGLDWIVPRWPAHPAVRAFVTTRNGGVSEGSCASLDAGGHPLRGDAAHIAAVLENRRRIRAWLPSAPHWLEQVHGTRAVRVDATDPAQPAGGIQADAAVTRERGVVLAIRAADCLPVLLCDRQGEVIGAAHAGWRGLAAGVLENAVAAMGCPPARVVAWLGPAIGHRAFEVGDEVRDAFAAADPRATTAFEPAAAGKWLADLEALARQRLARAGVGDVHGGGMCTMSDPSRYFSFRRDRTTARMAALIWLDATAGRSGVAGPGTP
ncbi:MAG TPA: peptidoglycan editing factor PgeF [Casimicrobiaceae bacterium]|nr:peptidoglycan editing factor PgeF [Casimicrobiaceae bacterium]